MDKSPKKPRRRRSQSIHSKIEKKENISDEQLEKIIMMIVQQQKQKDEMETKKLRRLSTEKEKLRMSRQGISRAKSLKKYVQQQKDIKINIKPKIQRKSLE